MSTEKKALHEVARDIGPEAFAQRLDPRYWVGHRYLADQLFWAYPDDTDPTQDEPKSLWVEVTGIWEEKGPGIDEGIRAVLVTCENGEQWSVSTRSMIQSFPDGRNLSGFLNPEDPPEDQVPLIPRYTGPWFEAPRSRRVA